MTPPRAGDRVPLVPLDVVKLQHDVIKRDPEGENLQAQVAGGAAATPSPLQMQLPGTPLTAAITSQVATPSGDATTLRVPLFPAAPSAQAATGPHRHGPFDVTCMDQGPQPVRAPSATRSGRSHGPAGSEHEAASEAGSAARPLGITSETDAGDSPAAVRRASDGRSADVVKSEAPETAVAAAAAPTPPTRGSNVAGSEVAVAAPSARSVHSASAVFARAKASRKGSVSRKRSLAAMVGGGVAAGTDPAAGTHPRAAADEVATGKAWCSSPVVLQARENGTPGAAVKKDGPGRGDGAAAAHAVATCEAEVAHAREGLVAAQKQLETIQNEWPDVCKAIELELVRRVCVCVFVRVRVSRYHVGS